MIDKFNGIFYLIVFLAHFIGVGVYAYQMIIGNQKFREKFKIEISPYDIERYEYHMEMEREDKYIETLENSSQSSSNSDNDYE